MCDDRPLAVAAADLEMGKRGRLGIATVGPKGAMELAKEPARAQDVAPACGLTRAEIQRRIQPDARKTSGTPTRTMTSALTRSGSGSA